VLAALRLRRRSVREEMVRALRSPRTTNLLSDWGALLEGLIELPVDDRPGAARPVGELAGERIRNLYKRKALCIKLRGDDELPHRLSRKLGPRLVFERDLVLPVTDIEDAMGALKDGLQRHRGASAPAAPSARRGHRRGKRGRR